MFPVFINGFGVNKEIINVNNGEMTKGIKISFIIFWNSLEAFLWSKGITFHSYGNPTICFIKILINFTSLDLPKPRFHIEFRESDNITQPMY